MRKFLLSISFIGLIHLGALMAQDNKVAVFQVPAPDRDALSMEDDERNKQGVMHRIGVPVAIDFDIHKDGTWSHDEQGNLIYEIKFVSQGALGLNVSFNEFTLPEASQLRFYNNQTNTLIGPYTEEHSTEDGFMTTAIIKGEYCIMELIIPASAQGELKLDVNEIGYFYRNIDPYEGTRALGDSDPCEVNVNCSEGASWTDESRGVARILVKDGGFGWCSGSLVNNTLNDCTPYFLTAQHCGAGASASDFRQWVFYFKYEGAGCSDPASEPITSNVTGSVRVAASGTASTINKSDFLLLILKNRPVASANAYYNGWSKSTTASSSGVSIHHPASDIKKISTYSNTLTHTTWDGTPNSHWRVTWVATANGHGVTEGGSSGSPIFNNSGYIVGDLSGGGSFCTATSQPDAYGKFSYSWSSCGATAQLQLAPWLDKNSTNPTTLTGKDNNCAAGTLPTVDFVASNVYPLVSTEVVTLTDQSTQSPFYWQWVISPTTYAFTGGTNAYSQNPQVTFSATGNYTVTLYVANTAGYNYKAKASYIHVGGIGFEEEVTTPVVMYPNPATDVLYINLGENSWNLDLASVTIMDLTGKYVLVEKLNTNANIGTINLPSNLASGMYIVRVTDGTHETIEKIEINKQ